MNYKKVVACLLISGFAHKTLGMEALSSVVNRGATLVSGAYDTIKTKLHPLDCLENFKREWDSAKTRREQITLLQLAHRAFLDHHMAGFLQGQPSVSCDFSKLVEHLEATANYPISPLVHDTSYEFLNVKIPIVKQTKPELLQRTVLMFYMLRTESLSADIMNNNFSNTLNKLSDREIVANEVLWKMLKAENIKALNELCRTIKEKSGVATLNSSVQTEAKKLLTKTIKDSFDSLNYLYTLNADDPMSIELKKIQDHFSELQARSIAVEESNARTEQSLQTKLAEVLRKKAELAAQQADQERKASECAAQEQALTQQEQQFAARAQELEARKAKLAAYIAEQQAKEQAYMQELAAVKANQAQLAAQQQAAAVAPAPVAQTSEATAITEQNQRSASPAPVAQVAAAASPNTRTQTKGQAAQKSNNNNNNGQTKG